MGKTTLKIPLSQNLGEQNIESILHLIDDLSKIGIEIELTKSSFGNSLVFNYDKESYKRNAGRKKKDVPSSSFLNNMTQEQIDEWLLDNTIDAIQKELNIGRSTAFRRRTEARERITYSVISINDDDILEENSTQ